MSLNFYFIKNSIEEELFENEYEFSNMVLSIVDKLNTFDIFDMVDMVDTFDIFESSVEFSELDIDSIYFLPSNLLKDLLEIKLSGIKRKRV